MARSDFEARLGRLNKAPLGGESEMLEKKVSPKRRRSQDEGSFREEDSPDSWSAWLMALLLISFMALGTLFAQDPEDAKRKAIVVVPLMLLVLVIVAFREFRRSRLEYLHWNFWVDLDFIQKLLRMMR